MDRIQSDCMSDWPRKICQTECQVSSLPTAVKHLWGALQAGWAPIQDRNNDAGCTQPAENIIENRKMPYKSPSHSEHLKQVPIPLRSVTPIKRPSHENYERLHTRVIILMIDNMNAEEKHVRKTNHQDKILVLRGCFNETKREKKDAWNF